MSQAAAQAADALRSLNYAAALLLTGGADAAEVITAGYRPVRSFLFGSGSSGAVCARDFVAGWRAANRGRLPEDPNAAAGRSAAEMVALLSDLLVTWAEFYDRLTPEQKDMFNSHPP